MAIARNAGGLGKYIKEDGEYAVRVKETKAGLAKSGKRMLTVIFQAHDEKEIAGYFVQELGFHMKALEELKLACGLKITDAHDHLVGKECGILVEMGDPDDKGRAFASIVGYGKISDLGGGGDPVAAPVPAPTDNNVVPF